MLVNNKILCLYYVLMYYVSLCRYSILHKIEQEQLSSNILSAKI